MKTNDNSLLGFSEETLNEMTKENVEGGELKNNTPNTYECKPNSKFCESVWLNEPESHLII